MSASDEPGRVAERYARRGGMAGPPGAGGALPRHHPLQPDVWQTLHERQRAMLRLWATLGWTDPGRVRVLEVGCGAGGNLLELLRLGFLPEQMQGVELLPERLAHARSVLPASVMLHGGDATALALPEGSVDMVLQSTVFSSLLDDAFQARLAAAMWRWLAPGGGVLWYDLAVDNPFNRDVRGVPMARVRQLFPGAARVLHRRVTLAPPLARAACRLHPSLYPLFNLLPPLRTHRLAWIEKP